MVLPLLKSLKDILNFVEQDSELANKMRAEIIDNICSRYCPEEEDFSQDVQRLLHLSSYLDPRFKNTFVRAKESLRERVVAECDRYCKQPSTIIDNAITASSCVSDNVGIKCDVSTTPSSAKRMKLTSFLPTQIDEADGNVDELDFSQRVKSEILLYEASAKLKRDDSVLEW